MCMKPVWIKSQSFFADCGSCLFCIRRRSAMWTIRLTHQLQYSRTAVFVTLTYNSKHLPHSPNGRPTLHKRDLQLFFKRLRRQLGPTVKIKYFACGEYGPRTRRPHYHAIIYGLSTAYTQQISDCWSLGYITCSSVTPNRVSYVTGYCLKKSKAKEKAHGVSPTFQLQSQKMGLQWALDNAAMLKSKLHITSTGGYKHPIPRYYRKKLDITADDYKEVIADKATKLDETLCSAFPDGYIIDCTNNLILANSIAAAQPFRKVPFTVFKYYTDAALDFINNLRRQFNLNLAHKLSLSTGGIL